MEEKGKWEDEANEHKVPSCALRKYSDVNVVDNAVFLNFVGSPCCIVIKRMVSVR